MNKITTSIIISILVLVAFGAGMFFKEDLQKWYQSSSWASKEFSFEKLDIGNLVDQVKKEVSLPSPLKIGGAQQQTTLLKSKIIEETNLQRKENGNLPALKENAKLDQAASAKAADMFKNQYFEHNSPAGIDPGKLVQSYGYDYIIAGENLILGNFSSEKDVVQNWMNSPGHRANILNNRYSEIGVAVVKGVYKGETVWIGVQEFGLPMSSCSEPNAALKDNINSNKNQIDAMSAQITQQKTQIENTSSSSPAYRQMINDYNALVERYNSLVDTTKSLVAQYNQEVNSFNSCVSGK